MKMWPSQLKPQFKRLRSIPKKKRISGLQRARPITTASPMDGSDKTSEKLFDFQIQIVYSTIRGGGGGGGLTACGKTKATVITLTNHNRCKQHNEPIRTRSNYMQPASSAGERVRANHD